MCMCMQQQTLFSRSRLRCFVVCQSNAGVSWVLLCTAASWGMARA
jgi:hypothetical protein